jgi:hypothetical protein
LIRHLTCIAALVGLSSSVAAAAELSIRAGDADHSTTLTLEIGETAAVDILVQLEADEVLGFANVFPSVGPFDDGPEFFEAIDFQSDWDPNTTEHVGHAIIISRAEGTEFAFDFGEGIFWNQYVMIFTADGVAGPGLYLLERLIIHGVAEGTTQLQLDGTLTELFTPDNERLTHSFPSPALRVTVLKGEDDENDNSSGNDNAASNDNTAANDNAAANDNGPANDNAANDNAIDNDNAVVNDNASNDNKDDGNDNADDNQNDNAGGDNDNGSSNANDNVAENLNDNSGDNDNGAVNDNGLIGGGNSNGGSANDNGAAPPPTPIRLCGANAAASLSLGLAGLVSMRVWGLRRRRRA